MARHCKMQAQIGPASTGRSKREAEDSEPRPLPAQAIRRTCNMNCANNRFADWPGFGRARMRPRVGRSADRRCGSFSRRLGAGRTNIRSCQAARQGRACALLGDLVRTVPEGNANPRFFLSEASRARTGSDRDQRRSASGYCESTEEEQYAVLSNVHH